jgi:hypothetical protein
MSDRISEYGEGVDVSTQIPVALLCATLSCLLLRCRLMSCPSVVPPGLPLTNPNRNNGSELSVLLLLRFPLSRLSSFCFHRFEFER